MSKCRVTCWHILDLNEGVHSIIRRLYSHLVIGYYKDARDDITCFKFFYIKIVSLLELIVLYVCLFSVKELYACHSRCTRRQCCLTANYLYLSSVQCQPCFYVVWLINIKKTSFVFSLITLDCGCWN